MNANKKHLLKSSAVVVFFGSLLLFGLIAGLARGDYIPAVAALVVLGVMALTIRRARRRVQEATFTNTAAAISWKHEPFRDGVPIPYQAIFNSEQFARLKAGLIPQEMEYKWFIYYEEPHLFLHRSWGVEPVYRLALGNVPEGAESPPAHKPTPRSRIWGRNPKLSHPIPGTFTLNCSPTSIFTSFLRSF